MLHGNFWPKTCQCPHIEKNTSRYNLGGWNALVQYSSFSEFDYLWLFVEEHGTRALHTIVLLILHTVWLFLTISDKACARLWLLVTKCAQFGGLAKTWSRITAKHRLLFPCQVKGPSPSSSSCPSRILDKILSFFLFSICFDVHVLWVCGFPSKRPLTRDPDIGVILQRTSKCQKR